MAHPDNAFAFNEHSLQCCTQSVSAECVLEFLGRARAWRLHESQPLVARLKDDPDVRRLVRDPRYHDKILSLLDSAFNRPALFANAAEQLKWAGEVARGLTVSAHLGGWALSFPCHCVPWKEPFVVATTSSSDEIKCRHASSFEHLRFHWQAASRAARKRNGRPASVRRVDDAMNESFGEVPQIHFADGTALNIDGTWKHGRRSLNAIEREWLARVGWVVPAP